MRPKVMEAFFDELEKIAAENLAATPPQLSGVTVPSPATKPASISTGAKPKTSLKTDVKTTDYSVVNKATPMAAHGAATAAKSVPPPPVRT